MDRVAVIRFWKTLPLENDPAISSNHLAVAAVRNNTLHKTSALHRMPIRQIIGRVNFEDLQELETVAKHVCDVAGHVSP